MNQVLKDPKTARVFVCESSSVARKCLIDVLRAQGFANVAGVANPKDLLEILEVEPADWVITTLDASEPVNGIHLLKLFTEVPRFRRTRTSLLLRKGEEFALPLAYELGALSHHDRSMPATFGEEFGRLRSTLEQYQFDATLTAAVFLRRHLRERRAFRQLLSFEKSLLGLYPGASDVLFNIAETHFLADERSAAISVLHQASLLGTKHQERAQELQKRYDSADAGGDPFDLSEPTNANRGAKVERVNALGIDLCLLIDPDTSVQYAVKQALTDAGVGQIVTFSSGAEAWTWIEAGNRPDVVIQEWRLPGLPGPLLVQRMRQHGLLGVPIIVISSLIKPEDVPLVEEMGVSVVVEKPLEVPKLLGDLIWTLQQQKLPTEQVSMERKIRHCLELGRLEEAKRLEQRYMSNETFDEASKLGIVAEFAYYQQDYVQARDVAFQSLKLLREPLPTLNLLGKALLKLGDHADALRCFAKAQALSPKNVSRLCQMAMIELEMDQPAQAAATLEQAKSIDGTSPLVVETEAKVALASGDTKKARAAIAKLESLSRILSFMNNKAVAMTRCGRFEDGISLYRSTLQSLAGDWGSTHDIVQYNLALAYVRYSELEQALLELEKVKAESNVPLGAKVNSLRTRLKQALASNESFTLAESRSEPKSKDATAPNGAAPLTFEAQLGSIESRPGDVCCYRLFFATTLLGADSFELLQNQPRFRERASIERQETPPFSQESAA